MPRGAQFRAQGPSGRHGRDAVPQLPHQGAARDTGEVPSCRGQGRRLPGLPPAPYRGAARTAEEDGRGPLRRLPRRPRQAAGRGHPASARGRRRLPGLPPAPRRPGARPAAAAPGRDLRCLSRYRQPCRRRVAQPRAGRHRQLHGVPRPAPVRTEGPSLRRGRQAVRPVPRGCRGSEGSRLHPPAQPRRLPGLPSGPRRPGRRVPARARACAVLRLPRREERRLHGQPSRA
jgi:hypothetical protein